ncbi:MAG: hypothetical protein HN778_05765 [Prolixibacteraceae bacterium]|jgi:hypothetical protein|nr:hypothetical protein [Prolixibacteraceae bacterium]MBT6764377.1 hypothetical protein [Prolixibacteraceae bacterium]MBT6999428.1 hypothetical protein [Prolixibacteraceae bacterium]MBT7394322.1 hypothetical protein [Prolixibacteraceae bacterium]
MKYHWISTLIAFAIGVIYYKSIKYRFKYIFFFVLFGVFTELSTKIITFFWIKNTMPVGHFYIPISLLILTVFYSNELKGYIPKNLLIGLISSFLLFCLINEIFIQSIFDFPNLTGSIAAIILLLFSILLFSKIMLEAKIKKLTREPLVWINTGVLLYYSANLFFYALFDYSLKFSTDFTLFTILIFSVFNVVFYILISIGFIKTKNLKTSGSK